MFPAGGIDHLFAGVIDGTHAREFKSGRDLQRTAESGKFAAGPRASFHEGHWTVQCHTQTLARLQKITVLLVLDLVVKHRGVHRSFRSLPPHPGGAVAVEEQAHRLVAPVLHGPGQREGFARLYLLRQNKGRAQAVPDLLGGRIEMIFDNMPSALPLVKAGEVRAIGVTSAARSPAAPNIPTIAEQGLPGFEATSWFALLAPAGLPRDVQLRISAETARVLALPDVKEKLTTLGLDPSPGTPEALAALIQVETVKWAKVVKESGAKPD